MSRPSTPMPGDVFTFAERQYYVLRRLKGVFVFQFNSGPIKVGSIPPDAQRVSGAEWAPVADRVEVDGVSYVDVDGQVFIRKSQEQEVT